MGTKMFFYLQGDKTRGIKDRHRTWFYFLIWLIFCSMALQAEAPLPLITPGHLEKKFVLDNFLYLESAPGEGKYITGDPITAGFMAYKGGKLSAPQDQEALRMFTFRQGFVIDRELRGQELYLYMGPVDYPVNIYLNGMFIDKISTFRGQYDTAIFYSRKVLLSPAMLHYGEANEIAFEIFPKYQETPLQVPFIAGYATVSQAVFMRNLLNFHFQQTTVIISLIIFIYFLFLFILTRFKQLKYFAFACTCLFYSLGYISFFMYEGGNELLLFQLSRAGLFTVVAALGLFIIELTRILRKKAFIIPYIVFFILVPVALVLAESSMHKLNLLFTSLSSYTITPLLIFNIILTSISVFRHKNRSHVFILFSLIVVAAAGLYDLSFMGKSTIPYFWTVAYAYTFLLIVIFFLLAREQATTYFDSLARTKELDHKNLAMKTLVENILTVSGQLLEGSNRLAENITEAVRVTNDYQKINNDIKEKIGDQLTGIKRIMLNLSKKLEEHGERIPKAIANQNTAIESTVKSILTMNEGMDSMLHTTIQSSEVTEKLYDLSSQSTTIVEQSRQSILEISARSNFIKEVMDSIQELSEKTKNLSINAAIESVRAGTYGKGFAIIANEVRNLATKSKDNLKTSLDKLQEMFAIITESSTFSQEVTTRLTDIITMSKSSAGLVNGIESRVKEQKLAFEEILALTKNLAAESRQIRELTEQDRDDNFKTTTHLKNSTEIFTTITALLMSQKENETKLYGSIENIRAVLQQNLTHIKSLHTLSGGAV